MMKRRAFCLRSSAGMALLALAPWAVQSKSGGKSLLAVPLPGLRFETFAGQLNTLFVLHLGEGGVVPLRLIRAEMKERTPRENSNAPDAGFERFSLVFAGRRGPLVPQESYVFEHPRIGRFEMFIAPVISRDPARHKFEAVFNRPVAV